MTILRTLCALAAVSCAVANGQAIAGDLNPLVDARDAALSAYDSGHYERAAGYFQIAADLGDARSAETLALMYRFGPR
ncbi:MAG: hypothetical protein ABJB04_06490, partial [Betaproteobacteria bacterium]